MSSWFDHWDRRYTDRVRLLVEILPVLAQEPRFALKGGTAINLFEHDLPRLSVDIDLAWLPANDYATDVKSIAEALERLAAMMRARPMQLQVQTSRGEGGALTRLVVSRGRTRVQIETTPVMRDASHQQNADFAEGLVKEGRLKPADKALVVQVLDFADLYAGKLSAALSRQHPRDLFDVGLLLRDERADQSLWRTFLVYLTCSPKPVWDMLAPPVPADFAATFETHFKGMTTAPVSMDALLKTREQLLARVAGWLDPSSRAFLLSVETERPDFGLIGLLHAADLPGVRRKLYNLAQRTPEKRAADRANLEDVFARIVPSGE